MRVVDFCGLMLFCCFATFEFDLVLLLTGFGFDLVLLLLLFWVLLCDCFDWMWAGVLIGCLIVLLGEYFYL